MKRAQTCFSHALKLLNHKAFFEKELETKLIAKGFPQDERVAALKKLKDLELIDDVALSQLFIESQLRKGFGPYAILQKLRLKSALPPAKLETLCFDIATDDKQREVIEHLLTKRPPSDPPRRLMQYLAGRGFSQELIFECVAYNNE